MESNSSLKRGFQVSLKSSMMVVKEWMTFTSGWNISLKNKFREDHTFTMLLLSTEESRGCSSTQKKMPPRHFLMQPTRRHHAGCTHYSLSGDSDSLKELEEAAGKQDIWVGGAKKLQTALCLAAECRCSHGVTVWIIWVVELTDKNCWKEHLGVSVCPNADKQFLDVCWIFYQASKSVTSRVRCRSYKDHNTNCNNFQSVVRERRSAAALHCLRSLLQPQASCLRRVQLISRRPPEERLPRSVCSIL